MGRWLLIIILSSSNHPDVIGFLTKGCFPLLSESMRSYLGSEFKDEELANAVMEMSSFKALSADGFQAIFYQRTWSIKGQVVTSLVNRF